MSHPITEFTRVVICDVDGNPVGDSAAGGTFNVLNYGADNTGANPGTFHTVLESVWTVAREGSRAHIRIPCGTFRVNASIDLLNEVSTATEVTIEGAGSYGTRITAPAGIGTVFKIGDAAGEQTVTIALKGFMTVIAGTTADDTHFTLINCKDISFDDVYVSSGHTGWSIGVGAAQENDCTFIRLQDCGGSLRNAGLGPMFKLGSGAGLQIGGQKHRWNSSGDNIFIDYVHDTYSWDGVYVNHVFSADFKYYLNMANGGKTIGNIEWCGGQIDGATIAFNIIPQEDNGSVRGLLVSSVSVRQCAKFMHLDTTGATGVDICGVHVVANEFNKVDTQIVETAGGAGTLFGMAALNQIRNGGSTGTELFKIGANTDFVVGHNFAYNDPVEAPASPYTYGVNFGGTTGHEFPNVFKNFATARSNRIPRTSDTHAFQATNTAASTPNNMVNVGINNVGGVLKATRAGRIIKMGCGLNAPVVAGTCTVFPRINTTDHSASMVCTLDSSNQVDTAIATNDGIPYVADDIIHLRYSPDGSWNPTGSNDLSAWVTIIDDP